MRMGLSLPRPLPTPDHAIEHPRNEVRMLRLFGKAGGGRTISASVLQETERGGTAMPVTVKHISLWRKENVEFIASTGLFANDE